MGVPVVGTLARKVFGSRNERLVKRYLPHRQRGLQPRARDP